MLTLALSALISFSAQAEQNVKVDQAVSSYARSTSIQLSQTIQRLGLEWSVNDNASYKLEIGSFLKGDMTSKVREKTAEGFWVEQNMKLNLGGAQKIEILFDANSGAIKKLLVNGKEQAPPEQGDMEVIEMKEARVTVPAGTFDVVYVKIRDTKKNETQEAWINPKLIPISGLVQAKSPSQFGEAKTVLTAYDKK